MSSIGQPRDPYRWLRALAFLVPFVFYVPTTSAFDFWLDSGELAAASANLGIAHPPGQPVAALWGRIFAWLPVGPMPWRIALANAVAAALASQFLFAAIEMTLVRIVGARSWKTLLAALGGAWLAAFAPGFWLQAVRPEVYAVQALLGAIFIERLIALESQWPSRDVRPLFAMSLALGFALANHHFLALLWLPAAAPTFARVLTEHGRRPLVISSGFVLLGLLTYLYLPLRAFAGPDPSLGSPTSIDRFLWVVSAEVFQQSSNITPQPTSDRMFDVVVTLFDSMGPFVVLTSVLGIYVLARTQGMARFAWVWATLFLLNLIARGWLGFVRHNLDAQGYLMPAFGACAALSAAFFVRLATLLARTSARIEKLALPLCALIVLALGLSQTERGLAQADLSSFDATDAFDDLRRRDLPYGAVVITSTPSTTFRHWGGEASERLRPDLTLVPIPFLAYPGAVDALVMRDPDLVDLLRGFLFSGELNAAHLRTLALKRPVFIEMDPVVPSSVYRSLVPTGGLYEVLAEGATNADLRVARRTLQVENARLAATLGAQAQNHDTHEVLLWKHYCDALFFAAVGDREGAQVSVQSAIELSPTSPELLGLAAAVADVTQRGPIDIAPFLPHAAHAPTHGQAPGTSANAPASR